jgi:hypothetical protein
MQPLMLIHMPRGSPWLWAQLPAPGPLRRIRGMPLTKTCGLAGPDPACLPLAIAVISEKVMSDRIDVRGNIRIAGTYGRAICGEVTALTREASHDRSSPASAR